MNSLNLYPVKVFVGVFLACLNMCNVTMLKPWSVVWVQLLLLLFYLNYLGIINGALSPGQHNEGAIKVECRGCPGIHLADRKRRMVTQIIRGIVGGNAKIQLVHKGQGTFGTRFFVFKNGLPIKNVNVLTLLAFSKQYLLIQKPLNY